RSLRTRGGHLHPSSPARLLRFRKRFGGQIPATPAASPRQQRRAMRPPDSCLHWDDGALTAVEILRRAHDLVAFGWCQGADAADADRHPVEPWSARACYWSLLGALSAALGTPQQDMPEGPALIDELRLASLRSANLSQTGRSSTGTTTPTEPRAALSRCSQPPRITAARRRPPIER